MTLGNNKNHIDDREPETILLLLLLLLFVCFSLCILSQIFVHMLESFSLSLSFLKVHELQPHYRYYITFVKLSTSYIFLASIPWQFQ